MHPKMRVWGSEHVRTPSISLLAHLGEVEGQMKFGCLFVFNVFVANDIYDEIQFTQERATFEAKELGFFNPLKLHLQLIK